MQEMYMHGSRQSAIEGPYHSVRAIPPPRAKSAPTFYVLRHV